MLSTVPLPHPHVCDGAGGAGGPPLLDFPMDIPFPLLPFPLMPFRTDGDSVGESVGDAVGDDVVGDTVGENVVGDTVGDDVVGDSDGDAVCGPLVVGARVQCASSGKPTTVSAPNDCPMYSCFEHDVWMLTVCDSVVDVVWH